jgi:TP901 family phage tail tape measure protein
MPDYAVKTTFTARDRVSPAFDAMGRSADRFADKSASAFRHATKHGYKFGTIVKGILAANAIHGGLGMIGGAVQNATESFVDFDDIMVRAAVKFDDIGVAAKDLRGEINSLKKDTLALTRGTPFDPVMTANAVNELAASGYLRHGSALAGVKAAMSVATATGEDLATTTGNLSGMMGSFGLRTKDAAKEMANFKRLGDVMTLAANLSSVGISDLKETMEQVGPVSGLLGTDLEEAAAMAAILGNASIKGTEGATALKNIMLSLANSTKRAEIEANIGGLVDPDTGKIRKVSQIVLDVYSKLKKVFPNDQPAIAGKMNDLFGLRGIAGAENIAKSAEAVVDAYKKMGNAAGTAEDQAKAVADLSMKIKLASLKNAALTKVFTVFESFNAKGQKGIEGLIEKIEKFNVEPYIKGISATAQAFGVLFTMIQPFIPMMPYLIGLFVAMKVATAGWQLFTIAKGFYMLIKPLQIFLGLSTYMEAMTLGLSAFGLTLGTVAAGLAAVTVAWVAWQAAWNSHKTGKDNFISEGAQWLGLVPSLTTDTQGRVNGGGGYDKAFWSDWGGPAPAPNAKTEEAKTIRQQSSYQGQLTIAGAPAGSTLTSKSTGSLSPFNVQLLGANP